MFKRKKSRCTPFTVEMKSPLVKRSWWKKVLPAARFLQDERSNSRVAPVTRDNYVIIHRQERKKGSRWSLEERYEVRMNEYCEATSVANKVSQSNRIFGIAKSLVLLLMQKKFF